MEKQIELNENGTLTFNELSSLCSDDNKKRILNKLLVNVLRENEVKLVTKEFNNHPGNVENFWFPTTRKDVNKWFDNFLINRFELFGDYEDAVSHNSNILFHSAISPFINIGLITPSEIIEKTKKLENKIRINSYEGFTRQIIGWREFIRGI